MAVINPATGREFRWAKKRWKPTTRARWHKKTIYGQPVIGSVRAIAHLDWMNRRAKAVFGPGHGVEVIQSAFHTGVEASKGTHDYDLVYDLYIPGVGWWRQQRFFRNHGFWCWYRHRPLFGNHVHGICMVHYDRLDPSATFAKHGFKVGVYIDGGISTGGRRASSQIDDYVHRAFGLKDQHTPGSDRSWRPHDIHAKIFNLNAYIDRRKKAQAA